MRIFPTVSILLLSLSITGCALIGLEESDELSLKDVVPDNTWYGLSNSDTGDYVKLEFNNRTFFQSWYNFPCGDTEKITTSQSDYMIIDNTEISINGRSYTVVDFTEESWTIQLNNSDSTSTINYKKTCESLR